MKITQRITPFLTYISQAEEAAEFYVSVIPDSMILRRVLNPANQAVLTVEFEMCGMKFISLNAGQDWEFTEAFSLAIYCDTQEELDSLWSNLIADGGTELACGWLKDKYGMCWQVWPSQLQDCDSITSVSPDYKTPFGFTGKIEKITFELTRR